MEKNAKSPSSQLKAGQSTAETASRNTGNPGINLIIFLPFYGLYYRMNPLAKTLLKKKEASSLWLTYACTMPISWREAKECAAREGLPQVYHDCDAEVYGACRSGETQGSFREGIFIEHRCICMPAYLMPEELEAKEKKFFQDNPDW